ncbi:hypothetical protein PSPO01_09542 [Paraphaeosphaeria sporulosa]
MKSSAMQILAAKSYLQQAMATTASTQPQPHHTSTPDNSKPQCSVGKQPETHPAASEKAWPCRYATTWSMWLPP